MINLINKLGYWFIFGGFLLLIIFILFKDFFYSNELFYREWETLIIYSLSGISGFGILLLGINYIFNEEEVD